MCPNGHIYNVAWESFNAGNRCQQCYFERKRKKALENIISIAEAEGYQVISQKYHVAKIEFSCPNGHIFKMRADSFIKGHRCRRCFYDSRRYTTDKIKKYVEKYGYKLLSEYINASTKLKLKCPEGHICYIPWYMFEYGTRCRTCWHISCFGSSNPMWKGGITAEPYCDAWLDKDYKQSIKERDGNKCLNPYCFKTSKNLVIHHIDYDKKNCHPSNLITICDSCNLRANKDREWHTSWYQAIIYRRYIEQKNK